MTKGLDKVQNVIGKKCIVYCGMIFELPAESLKVEAVNNNVDPRYWHRSINPKKLIEVGKSNVTNFFHGIQTLQVKILNCQVLGEILSPLPEHDNAAAFEALQAA